MFQVEILTCCSWNRHFFLAEILIFFQRKSSIGDSQMLVLFAGQIPTFSSFFRPFFFTCSHPNGWLNPASEWEIPEVEWENHRTIAAIAGRFSMWPRGSTMGEVSWDSDPPIHSSTLSQGLKANLRQRETSALSWPHCDGKRDAPQHIQLPGTTLSLIAVCEDLDSHWIVTSCYLTGKWYRQHFWFRFPFAWDSHSSKR